MHTTQQLLDAAKARQGLPSDYKLGVTLGLTDSALSNYRKGRSHPDDLVGAKLADLAGLDAGYVLSCLHAERAKNDETRAVWTGIAERLQRAGVAAAVILSLGFWTGGPDGGALASETQPSQAASAGPLCIMSTRIRGWFVTFARRWLQIRKVDAIPASPAWAM